MHSSGSARLPAGGPRLLRPAVRADFEAIGHRARSPFNGSARNARRGLGPSVKARLNGRCQLTQPALRILGVKRLDRR